MDALDQLLVDVRGESAVLRKHGDGRLAASLEDLCDRVAAVTEEWRRFLAEPNALLFSGRGRDFLRARRADWQARGHAFVENGVWHYRQCVLPHRADVAAAYEAGLRGGSHAA